MADDTVKTKKDPVLEGKEATREPTLYRVFLLNDDYTTMDFVVFILESVFSKPVVEATQIMLSVHRRGIGLCGAYTREIAETKVESVHQLARERQYPLKCIMEKE